MEDHAKEFLCFHEKSTITKTIEIQWKMMKRGY